MPLLLALNLVLAAPPSAATLEAERLAKRSILEYNVGDFEAALKDATEAYRLSPHAGLLFNLGQCHRALHHWEQAEFFYRGYLRGKPDAENRDAVDTLIREMVTKQQPETGQAKPPATSPPPLIVTPEPVPPPPAKPAPTTVVATPAPLPAPPSATEPPPRTPEVHAEAPGRSHALAATLLGLGVAGLVLTGISTGEVVAYEGYRNGVANGTQTTTYATFQSQGNTANVFSALLFVGVGLAVAGGGGALLAW